MYMDGDLFGGAFRQDTKIYLKYITIMMIMIIVSLQLILYIRDKDLDFK